jgi:hypothetical protein
MQLVKRTKFRRAAELTVGHVMSKPVRGQFNQAHTLRNLIGMIVVATICAT